MIPVCKNLFFDLLYFQYNYKLFNFIFIKPPTISAILNIIPLIFLFHFLEVFTCEVYIKTVIDATYLSRKNESKSIRIVLYEVLLYIDNSEV